MTLKSEAAAEVYRVSISPSAWTDPPEIVPSQEFFDDARRYGVEIITPGRFSPMRQDISVIYAVDSQRAAFAQLLAEYVPAAAEDGTTLPPIVGGRIEKSHLASLYMARASVKGTGYNYDENFPDSTRLPDQATGGQLVEQLTTSGDADYLYFSSDYGIDHVTYVLFSMAVIFPVDSVRIDPDDPILGEVAALLGIELV